MSVRRSSRSAYRSLVELEKRAKEAEAAAAGPLWGEDAFAAEDNDDDSFDAERLSDDGEDIVDSDFDEPEDVPAPEEAEQSEKAARQSEREASRKARTGKYVDPALKANRRQVPSSRPQKKVKTATDGGNPSIHRSSLRRSTKIASMRAAEKRERRELTDAERRKKKAAREAEKPEVRVLTQKELLEEAKVTEEKNKESLQELLRLEEEKKRLPPPKKKSNEPMMSVRSRDGKQTVSFTSKDTDARKAMFPHMH